MNLNQEELVKVTKLTSAHIEQVTCVECCKYYLAPETASCGHTLCHTCWQERSDCPHCLKPKDRSLLRVNPHIRELTEHVQTLADAFEKLFKVKVVEALLDLEPEADPTKTVQAWLTSSQNQFSAPPDNSEKLSQETTEIQNPLNVSTNKIQIHTNTLKSNKPPMDVVVATIQQDDWDKVEAMPDTEVVSNKNKENVIGPMDIEPFYIDEEKEYTAINPRRSSRKRVYDEVMDQKGQEKQASKDPIEDADKKSNKAKQNWNNVKKMRKEFSKLNKKNKSKLNVSIEMCKKNQNIGQAMETIPIVSAPDIVENTPDINYVITKEIYENPRINSDKNQVCSIKSSKQSTSNSQGDSKQKENREDSKEITNNSKENELNNVSNSAKMPFYKKGPLVPNHSENSMPKIVSHTIDTNTNSNDDIEITIKVGNTITNIIVKKKNEIDLKLNTDREIQTSLGPHNLTKNPVSTLSSHERNIVINVDANNEIGVCHQAILSNSRIEKVKQRTILEKTGSGKINTDSAETATAQFEITDSVEKELSKIMEIEECPALENEKTKIITVCRESPKVSEMQKHSTNQQTQNKTDTTKTKPYVKSQMAGATPVEDEFINDMDIFDSESLKKPHVQYLKHTEPASSEIIRCTAKAKNKILKAKEKHCRIGKDEELLPLSKKAKYEDTNKEGNNKLNSTQHESEPINYDTIMDTVFANIDADIRESQNTVKNTLEPKGSQQKDCMQADKIQSSNVQKKGVTDVASQVFTKSINHKESENIFSNCLEKQDEIVSLATRDKKLPQVVAGSNPNEYLTPVMSQPIENHLHSNDSDDRSVVEETPQKSSFTKIKPKTNGASKDVNFSQKLEKAKPMTPDQENSMQESEKSIVNVTNSSVKSNTNETAIKADQAKPTETPLSIDKFVHEIQHKSTPFAKKSLNFESEQVDDITLCTVNEGIVNTTQERQFMMKAFENTPTPVIKNLALKHKKYVIAGSSLNSTETANLEKLCSKYKWTYSSVYTKDLTHLVIGVDDENRAQRTIKYMCALSASKWIVSYDWVIKCLLAMEPVKEEEYEVLDSTGNPGPMRSRLAKKKLFVGIKFFCMEPFSMLNVDTLKEMIISAGGTVVQEAKAVRVSDATGPALLLAEPENTQEDRFIYLAMELSIVPVNFEWVLNSLGGYYLTPIQDLLLCPTSLLPKATEKWPEELMTIEDDD